MGVRRFYIYFSLFVLSGILWAVYNLAFGGSVSVCQLDRATGIPCPSCGGTRSLAELSAGHFKEAFLLNPVGYLYAIGIVLVPFLLLRDFITGNKTAYNLFIAMESAIRRPQIGLPLLGLVLVNWGWNIYKFL